MRNLLSKATRQSVEDRIRDLDASMKPRWGRMNATTMLAHCSAHLRMAFGEIECEPKSSAFSRAPIKQLLVYVVPWPKSAPTAPELIQSDTNAWDDELSRLLELVDRFAPAIRQSSAPHPLFGTLSTRARGRVAYRHLDHHLRQFGV